MDIFSIMSIMSQVRSPPCALTSPSPRHRCVRSDAPHAFTSRCPRAIWPRARGDEGKAGVACAGAWPVLVRGTAGVVWGVCVSRA
eukprot:353660-Rhodomonas_salina.1